MTEFFIWLAVFAIFLVALIKAAELIAAGTQKLVGDASGSDMAVAAIGAALPEAAAAAVAVLQGWPELAMAIVIGSSIANILLVVGVSALAAKSLTIRKDHIGTDLPLFAASAVLFYFVAQDGKVVFWEGLLMLIVFFVYAVGVLSNARRELTPRDVINPSMIGAAGARLMETVGTRIERGLERVAHRRDNFWKISLMVLGGAILLAVSAHITIEALVNISYDWVAPTAMAMVVLAVAAAVPELTNSLKVIRRKRYEVALGNIFAATTANLLLVTGVAAMFAPLPLDGATLIVGLPFFVASTGLLLVSAFSGKVNFGQGLMYLFLYFLFFVKLFGLF